MGFERFFLYFFLFYLTNQLSCAIPVMPTGGPVDSEPPHIIESNPASESVNVETSTIRLVFSEYIDQPSLIQAITVTPSFDRPLLYRWRKTRVDINFPEPLRENTTYILTLDTNLRDANRVALKEPITLAFSTGPVINRGRIIGRVVDNLEGTGAGNFDIYAYALPDSASGDSLPERPDYRTQSGEDGSFSFEFLSEEPYYVVALNDVNRNRKPDANELFAVPPQKSILADSSASSIEKPWLVTSIDSVRPEIQRVRALSTSRFLVRFSESIQLLSRSTESWSLQDSITNQNIAIEDIYLYPEDPKQLYLITPPVSSSSLTLEPANVADSSGNPVQTDVISIIPSTSIDTLQTRFRGFATENYTRNQNNFLMLEPGQLPAIQFNQPVPTGSLNQFVTIRDSSETIIPFSTFSETGTVYKLSPDDGFPAGNPFVITVQGDFVSAPDTNFVETFVALSGSSLGELSGIVASEDSLSQLVVELYSVSSDELVDRVKPDGDGYFRFSSLPDEARYRLRAFLDRNENMEWDGGRILPYEKAESITWYTDSLQVRARWEQSLPDTLRIPGQ